MPEMIVMCGLPGSGKTTWAKSYADASGYQYIGVDDFYKLLNGDERLHENKFEVWMAIYRALHIAETHRRSVVFDTNAPTVTERSQLITWFPSFDHTLVYIRADENLCRKNNLSRRRVVPEEEMRRLIDNFQVPRRGEDNRWHQMIFLENRCNNYYNCWGWPYDDKEI